MKLVRLGDHAQFLSGFAFKSKHFNEDGTGLPIVRIRDVVRGRSETFYSGEYDERYVVSPGEYLIGMDGEFNLAQWKFGNALLNQRVCKIDEISHDLDRNYLSRFLPVALKAIEDATPFVTVKHLSVKTLNETRIPLPPLEEQKRIAAILDAADDLRAKRRESLAQLDALLQSTFLDMFGDPVTNPMGWEERALKETKSKVQIGPFGSLLHKEDYLTDGVPVVNPMHIVSGKIQAGGEQTVSEHKAATLSNYRLEGGDVVMGRRGEMGRCAVVSDVEVGMLCGTGSLYFRPDPSELSPLFLAWLLSSASMKRHLDGLSQGVTMPNLNQNMINNLRIALPPLDLQRRFAAIVDSVEQQKAKQRAHLDELDTLFASLQSRAFKGEL